jgi:hypothetical protein
MLGVRMWSFRWRRFWRAVECESDGVGLECIGERTWFRLKSLHFEPTPKKFERRRTCMLRLVRRPRLKNMSGFVEVLARIGQHSPGAACRSTKPKSCNARHCTTRVHFSRCRCGARKAWTRRRSTLTASEIRPGRRRCSHRVLPTDT